eukprot:m.37276 g.37276  ORF g.37276 m.37276 type:complete len:507 (+) comp9291_c0_seq1:26-1546(+)
MATSLSFVCVAVLALTSTISADVATKMQVLSVPNMVRFDEKAGAMTASTVPGIGASVLGVQAPQEFFWRGLYPKSSLFENPEAIATIIVDGAESLPAKSKITYDVKHETSTSIEGVRTLVSGFKSDHSALTDLVSDAFGETSNVCVSGNSEFASVASFRDIRSGVKEHTITVNGKGYVDHAINTESIKLPTVATNEKKVFMGVEFVGSDLDLFAELDAMVAAAKIKMDGPTVFTFIVSKYSAIVNKYGENSQQSQAALKAISETAMSIASILDESFSGNALVMSVGLKNAPQVEQPAVERPFKMKEYVESRHPVIRRNAKLLRAANDSMANRSSLALSVSNCQDYTCACFKAYAGIANNMTDSENIDGRAWAPVSNAATDVKQGCLVENTTLGACKINGSEVKCNTICANDKVFCPCESELFDPSYLYPVQLAGLFKCQACNPGFLLKDGACYLESGFTATFNIALWTGLAGVAALAGIWYALHTIGAPIYSSFGGEEAIGAKKAN